MGRFDNYTIFGMHSRAERYSWAAYHLVIFLSTLLGDTLILYATFQKGAFKLNKFIVTIIQYIAVCDLLYAVTVPLTGAVSLIANGWVLGDPICYVKVYLSYFVYPAGLSLIAALTTSKLLILKYPIRSTNWTKKTAHKVCIPLLTVPLPFWLTMMIVDNDDSAFDYKIYSCKYFMTADIWKVLLPIMSTITMFIPNIVIVATTIPTLKYLYTATRSARRAGGSVPWQGTLTVALTAVVYCITSLPLFISQIIKDIVKEHPTSPNTLLHYQRISFFVSMLNIMSNFYIYAMTVRSFRRFLLGRIVSHLSFISQTFWNMTSSTEGNSQDRRVAGGNNTESHDTPV